MIHHDSNTGRRTETRLRDEGCGSAICGRRRRPMAAEMWSKGHDQYATAFALTVETTCLGLGGYLLLRPVIFLRSHVPE